MSIFDVLQYHLHVHKNYWTHFQEKLRLVDVTLVLIFIQLYTR